MKSKEEIGDIKLSTDNAYQVLNICCQSFKSQDKTKLRMNNFEKSRGNWWGKKSVFSKGDNWKHFRLIEKWQKFW